MTAELDADIASGSLYGSKDFNAIGRAQYPRIIREVINKGNVETFTAALIPALFNTHRTDKNGKVTRLNHADCARRFAGGEFNRFYLRGLCIRAILDGVQNLIVYRAKLSKDPRPESEALVGTALPARDLLEDLRQNQGTGTYLGVPMGPHSGLSAKYVL